MTDNFKYRSSEKDRYKTPSRGFSRVYMQKNLKDRKFENKLHQTIISKTVRDVENLQRSSSFCHKKIEKKKKIIKKKERSRTQQIQKKREFNRPRSTWNQKKKLVKVTMKIPANPQENPQVVHEDTEDDDDENTEGTESGTESEGEFSDDDSAKKYRKTKSRSLPSAFSFHVSKENIAEEFGIAVNIFQKEMRKACEFGKDLVEDNKKLKDEMKILRGQYENLEESFSYEKSVLENELCDIKMKNNELIVKNSILEERNIKYKRENEDFRVDFDRVLTKNKQLRNDIFNLKSKKKKIENKLSNISSDKKSLIKEKRKLKRHLSNVCLTKDYLIKEKKELSDKLEKSSSVKNRLIIEKNILRRNIRTAPDVDMPKKNMGNYNSPTPQRRQLSNFVLMKNQIISSYKLTKDKKKKINKTKFSIRRVKMLIVRLRMEITNQIKEMNEDFEKVKSSLADYGKLGQIKERIRETRVEIDYANIQKKVIEDLGLIEFYQNFQKSFKKEGFVLSSTLLNWKKVFMSISFTFASLTLYQSQKKILKRFSLHGCKATVSKEKFTVELTNQKYTFKAKSEKEAFEWCEFIKNVQNGRIF